MNINLGTKTLMTLDKTKNIFHCLIFVLVLIPFILFYYTWWLFGGRIKINFTDSDKVKYLRWFSIKEN